ncbi:MAG: VIT and VWA domain-containing protein [Candidatus Thiodiazotropha sp.]
MKKMLFLLMILWCLPVWAEDQVPGGFIEAEHQGKKILFPLLKSHYRVDIQGDLAQVTLEQEFRNPTGTPLNASYLFPLNKDAAVHAMRMRVADELVEAKIHRLEEAKKTFAEAKQQGKSASLLEQHRPNMFTQQLANLMPDLPIHITLQYVQHIDRVDSHYELVLPLIVGPRYQPAETAQKTAEQVGLWQLEALPVYPSVAGLNLPKEIEQERVSIEIALDGGMPVSAVSSPTHGIEIKPVDEQHRNISLSNGRTIDNRDFELHYRLAGEQVQAGLLTHEEARGHFFSLLLEPPAIPRSEIITPREMVFVLDTSGSMSGDPLKASKAFMQQVLHHLRPSDTFRIIDFSNSPREFHAKPLPATTENLRLGQAHVQGFQAGGGTEIKRAIEQALSVPAMQNHLRIVVFLTDGYIGNEHSVLQSIQQLRGDARIYALGVGTAVNRYLLDEMALAGQGFVRYIDPTEEVEGAAQSFAERLRTPVLTDVSIDWGDTQVEQVTPAQLPDLFSGDSLRLLGKIQQVGQKPIKILGRINGQQATLPLKLQPGENTAEQGQAIPLIWARSRIADHMREMTLPNDRRPSKLPDGALKEKVTQLGLDFSLMTRWTAFIAVSQKVYNEQPAASKDVSVPLPMVKGVSQNAYPQQAQQFHGSSAPEAEEGLLLLMLLLAGLYWWQRRRHGETPA